MKSVTLLALKSESREALAGLRDLGVMQISAAEEISADSGRIREAAASAARTITGLESFVDPERKPPVFKPYRENRELGKQVIAEAGQCMERRSAVQTALEQTKKRLEDLAVWGKFDLSLLRTLQNKGFTILLCDGSINDLERAQSVPDAAVEVFYNARGTVRFALIADHPVEAGELPAVIFTDDDDPVLLAQRADDLQKQLDSIGRELAGLAEKLVPARRYAAELECALEFSLAADAVSDHGAVVSLHGYVPEPDVEALTAAARKNGWGLLITEPDADADVPVLIKTGRFARIIKPLFDFIGVTPGYHEIDVSAGVLVFFTIFYAMIIGDAGYGMIFLAVSLWADRRFRNKPAAKLPCRLFIILSAATVVWGALTGSWFGLANIPGTDKPIPGLPFFTDASVKLANTQAFCFVLAVAQLSLGRIWKAFHERNLRAVMENLGWMLIIWGNFFLTLRIIVYPGEFPVFIYWLYGIGLALVMLCGVKWSDPADVFQFPFSVIGSFTDVLSYIRLFAVGMAGACIASSFNGMALDVCRTSPWVIPAGILVILAGHLLNIALALMSVLVHGVRLNTLEFSNHTGLSWSGSVFKPFKNQNENKES